MKTRPSRKPGRGPASVLILLAAALVLTACGGPTPYKPADPADGYGYSDQALEKNRYRVSFSGNADTPRETVQNYLLYRAAELTLATGNDYFIEARQETEKSTQYVGDAVGVGSFGSPFCRGFGCGFGISTTTSRPIDRYEAYAIIVTGSGPKPDDLNAYDAREVKNTLETRIVRQPDAN